MQTFLIAYEKIKVFSTRIYYTEILAKSKISAIEQAERLPYVARVIGCENIALL